MRSYVRFQFATLSRKFGIYIIAILAIAITALIAIISIRSANNQGTSWVNEVSTFTKFFPFLFAVLFSSHVITHVFKEGESDGSELIIVAKPLTRGQIVFGKFLVTLMYILIFQVILFASYFAIAEMDNRASFGQKMNWALSLFVGGLIVQLIASSIIIMLASVLGKVGTTVVSILFAAMIPIISFILVPLGKGWRASALNENSTYQKQVVVDTSAQDGKIISENANDIYERVTPEGAISWINYKNAQWYDKAAYFDVWYHWGRFYSMFMPTESSDTAIVQWGVKPTVTPESSVIHTTSGGDWSIMLNTARNISDKNKIIQKLVDQNKKAFTDWIEIDANKLTLFNNAPLLNRIAFIASPIVANESRLSASNYTDNSLFAWNGGQVPAPSELNVNAIAALSILKQVQATENIADASIVANANNEDDSAVINSLGLVARTSDADYVQLASSPFLADWIVIIAWAGVGTLMCLGAVLIYARRDFK